MEWLDRLEEYAYNLVIDELVWHLREGRDPCFMAKVHEPEPGVEFKFNNAPAAFFKIRSEYINEYWSEAIGVISEFKELQKVRVVGNT